MTILTKICMAVLLLLWIGTPARNDSTMQLSRAQWQELSEGLDYSETFRETRKENDSSPASWNSQPVKNLGALKYLFYFLVLALIVFLVIRIFRNFNPNTEIPVKTITVDSVREAEENIHEADLDDLLKQALAAKNYRIAMRLNFLIIIKLLSQKGNISWSREKTNWEYYRELRDKLLADRFKELILNFELFWYGEHPLSELQYQRTVPLYEAMHKSLTRDE